MIFMVEYLFHLYVFFCWFSGFLCFEKFVMGRFVIDSAVLTCIALRNAVKNKNNALCHLKAHIEYIAY